MPPSPTTVDAPAPEVAPDARSRRIGLHVCGLALLLVLLMPLLGRDGLFSADEGAAVAQARLLTEGRGWAIDHPLPALDPEGTTFPLENASLLHRDDGTPAAAPFAKHPAYPVLLAPFDRLAGVAGMTLTSVLGAVAAAGVAGLLLRRLAPGLEPVAVWATGLATPLFVDSWIVIAHTLGAALAATAALAVVRTQEGRGGPALLTAGLAAAAAVLLRNEAALFGVALFLTAAALGVRRRERVLLAAAGAVLAGTVGGYLLDGVLSAAVSGNAESGFRAGVSGSGFLASRIGAALLTLATPSYGALGLPDVLLVLSLGSLLGAVVIARRRPGDVDGIRVFTVVAVLATVGRALLVPDTVPGLLVAAPALTAGLAAVNRRTLASPVARLLGGTIVLFTGAVLATQYASGGSGEWGGRYFALALPLAVPLAVLAVRDLVAGLQPSAARPLVAALVVVGLASAVLGGRSLRGVEDRTDAIVDGIDIAASDLDDPVVVSTGGAAPRFAWDQVLAGEDWLLVETEDLPEWLRRLRAEGRDVVLATYEPDEARTAIEGFTTLTDVRIAHSSSWTVIGLRQA